MPQESDSDGLPGWMEALISRLYDGVLAQAGFQRFIEALADSCDCNGVVLFTLHLKTRALRAMWVCGIADEWMQRYALDYSREDVFVEHLLTTQSPHFLASNLDLALDGEFEQTRFFREWLAPQGIVAAAGSMVLNEGDWCTQIVLQRSSAQPLFSRDDLNTLDRLMPHMRRALRMRERLADLEQGQGLLGGSLDVPAIPTLLLDEQNLVAYVNRGAAALLAADDSPLRLESGRLIARNREVNQRLHYEIGCAVRASRGESVVLEEVVRVPRGERLPLSLLITPLRPTKDPAAWPHGAALIFVFDPLDLPKLSTERVRKMFNLTAAEAHLAAALCRGATLDEVAAERKVSAHTVKSQLKSVFLRTGTNRQTELVALLLASPAYYVTGE